MFAPSRYSIFVQSFSRSYGPMSGLKFKFLPDRPKLLCDTTFIRRVYIGSIGYVLDAAVQFVLNQPNAHPWCFNVETRIPSVGRVLNIIMYFGNTPSNILLRYRTYSVMPIVKFKFTKKLHKYFQETALLYLFLLNFPCFYFYQQLIPMLKKHNCRWCTKLFKKITF